MMTNGIAFPRLHWGWLLLTAILIWFFWATSDILAPFIAGLIIAYLLDPLVDRLQVRRVPRSLATAIVLVFFFAIFAGVGILIAPLAIAQFNALLEAIPDLAATLIPAVERWYGQLSLVVEVDDFEASILQRGAEVATQIVQSVIEQAFAVFNILALLIIVPVVSFYALRDFDNMAARVRQLIPPRYAPTMLHIMEDADKVLGGFIRGQFLVCALLAVFYSAGWWLTGLEFALVLGLIAGILAFVPYLGAVISVALAELVGIGQFGFDPWQMFLIFLVFQAGQLLEGTILTPNLIGERIGLHPLWVLFAVFAGGELAGLWGVFVAVPVAAVVGVVIRAILRTYKHSPIYLPVEPPEGA